MISLTNCAQFLASLLVPVTLETVIRKTRNGLYLGCLIILLFVIGKEFIYDVFVAHQHVLSDGGDSVYYLLGGASAIIVVLTRRKKPHKKIHKKGSKE